MALTKSSLVLLLCFLSFCSEIVKSQDCDCCSRYGYTDDVYYGNDCQSGSYSPPPPPPSGGVGGIVTQAFFDGIISKADNACAGKRFYTRDSFVNAANTFSNFVNSVTKLEIATMFAHLTHESGHFCYIEEIDGKSRNYCDDKKFPQYPCAPGKKYYGRGPIQLTWNYNYARCGQKLNLNLLSQPELVGSDPIVAFRTTLWFWMNNVRPVLSQGFGATIRAINGAVECDGKQPAKVNARIGYYRDYCKQLGVNPGSNLSC